MLCVCRGDFPSASLGNLETPHFLASNPIPATTQWAVCIQIRKYGRRVYPPARIPTLVIRFSVIPGHAKPHLYVVSSMLERILSTQISVAVVLGREEGRFLINGLAVPRALHPCYGRRFLPAPK
jgi:hypothetical protein